MRKEEFRQFIQRFMSRRKPTSAVKHAPHSFERLLERLTQGILFSQGGQVKGQVLIVTIHSVQSGVGNRIT
jgi:hypothetical protein